MKNEANGRKGKIAVFIVALLGALLLWMYALGYDTQESTKNITGIPVEISGVKTDGYTVAGISDFSVTLDLEAVGTRSALNSVSASDFKAYVDISSVTKPGYATLPIQVVTPNGLKTDHLSIQNVSLYIDRFTSKTINIQVEQKFKSEYSIGEVRSNLYAVSVYGPESELANAEAFCSFDLGNITQAVIHASGDIMLRDASTKAKIINPYITMENSTVDVTFVMYDEKTIPIELNLIGGLFAGSDVQFVSSVSELTISGPVSELSPVSSLKLNLDENKLTSGKEYTTTIAALLSENGYSGLLTVSEPEKEIVYSVGLPKVLFQTVTLPASSITFYGVPDDGSVNISAVSSVEISIFGSPDIIKKYSSKAMTASVNYATITQNPVTGQYVGILEISTGDSRVGVAGSEYTVLLRVEQ